MKIAILGAGRMGSWLAREFSKGHEVAVYEKDSAKRTKLERVRVLETLEELAPFGPGLLVNAVSLDATVPVFHEVEKYLPGDCIVADLASVKGIVAGYHRGSPFRFVSVHPMFGPTFADLGSLKEENAIVIKESCPEGTLFFRHFFEELGVRVFEYSFAEHDVMMAYSLTLPFICSMAFSACCNTNTVPGTTFAKHMNIAKGLLSEDDHLLAEILFNPCSIRELEGVTARLEYLKHIIEEQDQEELKSFLQRMRNNIFPGGRP
ncbi:MAG: prephenate dehydrogenase [Syntrophorhabdus sp. PtaU1.Bin153]|nr:MAG: prephenate dehydrogenase [Syntrophorhabdus sp. PtaU1.Bin153]